jgi:Concanavalin A-like lectin/glucanases superfamily
VTGLLLAAALVVGLGAASADTIFSDGFESGDFSAWSQVKVAGGGSAVVQSAIVSTGSFAAQLSESSTAGSKAYVRKTFPTAQQDLTASGDFRVVQQGASGGNVPFFRLFASDGTTRIVSLFRQNVNGKIYVGYGGSNVLLPNVTLALNTWANLQLHVVVAGATSTVEVSLNGTSIYQTTSASLGTSGVSAVQIGNDTAGQAFTIVADTINVQNGGSLSPPSNTAPPTIAGETEQGQVLSTDAGSWSGTQPITYAYQWQRCDTGGANCTNIGSPTSTYALTSADIGSTIVVAVTASNSAGSATASSVPTAIVAASPPSTLSPPTVSGVAQQGQTLIASPGSWSGAQPIGFAYQWQRCDANGANCANIGAATSSSYLLTSADVGSTIVVGVTAGNSAGSVTVLSTTTAVVQASSNILFSDGFESGDFSAGTLVKTGGNGTTVVQSSIIKTGTYAAQLSETASSGSLAYARKTLLGGQVDLTASGDFQVLQEGASGGNVPFFRFFASDGTTRIVSLYRQNVNGKIYVGYGGSTFVSSAKLVLNTWANLQLHVIIAATSTVEVRLNGTLIYQATSANLGTTAAAASVQLGNETAAQQFTLVADNIGVQTSNTGPPVNTAPPTISGSAQQGQTLTASPGSWSGAQPIGFAYQWKRCDASGANCANIGAASSSSYQLTSADVGNTIVIAVTASSSAGSAIASSAATMVAWTSSVVALWHMDETSGSTMFDSAGHNNGTLTAVTLGQPGSSGFSYGFDGSSSYGSVPSADGMNPGSANFSFTILLQTTGTPPPPPEDWDLIRKGDFITPGGEYKMEYQQSGQASCGFKGSTSYAELVAGPALNDGHWHSITCVKTSADIELIVDGKTFATAATVGSISNTAPVVVGSHPGADWYHGSLDEASISIGS